MARMFGTLLIHVLCHVLCYVLCVSALPAQERYADYDLLLSDLYNVISGPAGERDWDVFRDLFKPGAVMGSLSGTGELVYRGFTPEEYVERNAPFFKENAFYEREIGREVQVFGELMHVFSAYEFEADMPGGESRKVRGVNSIQLVFDMGRWWIVSIQWNQERDDNPIPKRMLRG